MNSPLAPSSLTFMAFSLFLTRMKLIVPVTARDWMAEAGEGLELTFIQKFVDQVFMQYSLMLIIILA